MNIMSHKLFLRKLAFLFILTLPLYGLRIELFVTSLSVTDIFMLAIVGYASVFFRQEVFQYIKHSWFCKKGFVVGIVCMIVGLFVGFIFHPSFHVGGVIFSWILLPLMSVIATRAALGEKYKIVFQSYYLSALGVSCIAVGYLLLGELTYDMRLKAFYLSPNHLAMYIFPAIIIGVFYGKTILSFQSKIERNKKNIQEKRLML